MANKTVTVKASGGDYLSLNDALAGEKIANPNLVSMGGILTIECYASVGADVAADTGSGWTTNSSNYIHIIAPAAERHDGKWNTSRYRIEMSGNSASVGAFTNRAEYTRLTGIQIKRTSDGSSNALYGVYALEDPLLIDKCIIWVSVNHGSCVTRGLKLNSSTTTTRNTVVFENGSFKGASDHYGIEGSSAPSHTLENVTCDGFEYNFISGSATVVLKNCVAQTSGASGGAAGGYFYPSCTTTGSTHNLSDKSDAIGTVTYQTKTVTFVDAANGDFHLAAGDTEAKNNGTDLSGTFTDDIDGVTRSGTWDLGADEYVASGGAATRNRVVFVM
jgi:hypothetical protein